MSHAHRNFERLLHNRIINNTFNMTKQLYFVAGMMLMTSIALAQSQIDGYVFEKNNRGFLNQASITLYRLPDNVVSAEKLTDIDGHFTADLPPGSYRINIRKDLFFDYSDTLELGTEKLFLKAEMERRPGYLFDATIAEARTSPDQIVDAISGARIEVYNRTTKKPEMVILDNPTAFFQFTFEQGNHYTMMLRKPGYLAKRIEAYVNIEGCIICVDGVRDLNPGVTDNLTAGNKMGTLLSNIELEKARLDKRITLRNIYYDYDKWDIRKDAAKELDKVVTLLRDNPGMSIELGSHTDSRGRDVYNDTLSQRRAEAAVAYIIGKGIDKERISAKGYGESQLTNRCNNNAKCSEEEHQLNRRTELRITKLDDPSLEMARWRSLEEIVREEEFEKELKALEQEQQVIQVPTNTPTPKKSSPKKNLPEANNSVPLPPIQPETVPSPTPTETGRIVALPVKFSGVTVLLGDFASIPYTNDKRLENYERIWWQKLSSGRVEYFIGEFATKNAALDIVTPDLLRIFPKAQVVTFISGQRTE
jgi:outer membrane protein OmpA-like peptidoglycan-associated protein